MAFQADAFQTNAFQQAAAGGTPNALLLRKKGLALVARILPQAVAYNAVVFMVLASDSKTGATGLSLTITASKDGAAFAAIAPTVTDLGSGWYKLALTSTHTSTLGDLALHITAATADPTDLVLEIGMQVPVTIATSAITDTTFGRNSSSQSLWRQLAGILLEGTAASATSTTLTLTTGGAVEDSISRVDGAYVGCMLVTSTIEAPANYRPSQVRRIVGFVASTGVITVDRAFTVTPDRFVIYANDANQALVGTTYLHQVDVRGWLGTAPTAPATAGVPNVNTTQFGGTTNSAWSATRGTAGTAIPAVASGSAGAIPTVGTGTAQLQVDGTTGAVFADAKKWNALTTVALPLIPTTAGRTLDVSAGGEAGVDWANVGTPASFVSLTNTTVGVTTTVTGGATAAAQVILQADTDDLQTRLPAALVAGRMDSSVGAMAANVITAAAAATDFGTEVATAVWALVVEGSSTAKQYLVGAAAMLFGKASGFDTATRTFRAADDSKPRVTANVDATGRTSVTLDLS